MKLTLWIATGLAFAAFGPGYIRADAQTNTSPAAAERIGVYDSRVSAYANFSSAAQQRNLQEMTKTANEARSAGQTERYKGLSEALKGVQERSHLRVFSTAPVDNVLADMKDCLPEGR